MNHDELRAVLTQALTEREAEAAKVRAAIAALDGPNHPGTVEQLQPAVAGHRQQLRPAPRRKATKPAGEYVCAECGQRFNRPNGLSRHMGQTHGSMPNGRPRPLEVVHRTPDTRPTDTGPLVLRCGQCGDEFPLGADPAEAMQAMRTHCRAQHDRSPNEIDRRPRPAAAAAVEVQS